ncbi:triokinase/FMN cyclase-like isoform X1 [Penaeus chinensis]|uniref:triokinase/FMN cyclase-like isoform X1 n=1 Tax=Penaeus chinensis TaxID=139456 RepID=UPI001FB7CC27|nr:triokinase/FMN cyclase-like isoform X1 [Penaeus chinensis]XP_047488460.1 triokinase/FMN cyclase-like isoform X1 [Penaeus chinensis]XP_047488461.1 triokinase/FMN cyclase-like isoform X1 [Penaeus chinensis]
MTTQLINTSERCVDEALEGLMAGNSGLLLLPEQRVVVERAWLTGRRKGVAIVTGGGSGHEPFAAGYVGEGMLAAAVAGSVFTSPPPASIAAAITAVGKDNPDGVLVVIFNYTGDRVNFGLAVERCRAAGMKVGMYVSGDDSALARVTGTAGRRGLCGTLFVLKIVGAMVQAGATLDQALETCHKLGSAMGTIGFAASACQMPGAPKPLFTVPQGMLELGLGVHGEKGAATIKAGTASQVMETLLDNLTREDSETRLDLQKGDEVAVIVNNLGCTSELEMGILRREVVMQLKQRGVNPIRVYQGSLMTSLDMKGVHISVLRILDPSWVTLLDAPTSALAWPTPIIHEGGKDEAFSVPEYDLNLSAREALRSSYTLNDPAHAQALRACLESLVAKVPQHEELLNTLDSGCGDGDCGTTLLLGIRAISNQLPDLPTAHPAALLASLGDVASVSMGGSSGGLYSILLTAAASHLASCPSEGVSPRARWAGALRKGVAAVGEYGGARAGDRTMLDALLPAVEALDSSADDADDGPRALLQAMATAADRGARRTKGMKARAGRASYVREEKVTGEDAGARAVACMLQALASY